MRTEGTSLDLNNLPEDYCYTSDGTQASGDSSSSAGGYRKKKSGGKEEKEEAGKVYECRFCSLKFCKSQALGGHMNRHRQERETETLNKARQLVFSNDLAPTHLGYTSSSGQQIFNGQSVYPSSSRMFSTSPLVPPPPPPLPPYPSRPQLLPVPSQIGPVAPLANEYYIGHAVSNSCYGAGPNGSYYTCIGSPVRHGLPNSGGGGGRVGGSDVGDLSRQNQDEGRNWDRR